MPRTSHISKTTLRDLIRISKNLYNATLRSPFPPHTRLAASEPGKAEPARGPCTCNRNHVDDDEHAPDCGKPAPVAFDADAVAKKMVHWNSVRKLWSLWQPNGEVCVCYLMPGSDDEEPGANELSAIKHIAAALRAAEAAGYARGRAEGQR